MACGHDAANVALPAQHVGPVYFRLGRSDVPTVTTPETPFEIGKAQLMYSKTEGRAKNIGIIVTGSLLYNALMAAVELEKEGVGVSVLHMATIKPLDTETLLLAANNTKVLITVEEHSHFGGLGSACAEVLLQNSVYVPFKIVGIPDEYTVTGSQADIFKHYGLSPDGLANTAKNLLKK